MSSVILRADVLSLICDCFSQSSESADQIQEQPHEEFHFVIFVT